MADINLKTATEDTSLDTDALLFGADSQSASSPSVYKVSTLKTLLLGGGSLAVTSAKTLTASNTLTLTGTDGSSVAFGTGGTVLYSGGALGTPSSGTLTNATGLPVGGISATGTPSASTFLRGDGSWQTVGSSTLTVGSTATSGGAAGQIMFDTGSVLSESSSLVWDNTNKLLTATGLGTGGGANTGGITVSGGALTLSGNISANAWTTSGIRYKSVAATLTDLTSTGTVTAAYTNVYGGNTIAASNATTFTDYFTTFITQPTAGTNVTFTNRWALGLSGNLKILGGTVTTSAPVLDLSQTWNGSGQVFRGISLNVTDTLSSLVSGLIDLQFGGSTYFRVGKGASGYAYAWLSPGITPSTSNYFLARGSAATYFNTPTGTFHSFIYNDGNARATFFTDRAALANNMSFGWSSTTTGSDTLDLILNRAAAATLQLGAADANPAVAQTLQVQSGSGTNINGADWSIVGSMNTGSGTPGKIIFKTGISGGSSSTKATPQSAWAIDGAQALYPAATLSTSMTNGFLNIPGGAGAPSGTPANTTGFPLYWDSTNLKLYVYSGGAWKASAAFT